MLLPSSKNIKQKKKQDDKEEGLFDSLFPKNNVPTFKLSTYDCLILLFCYAFGLLTRFIRIQFPRTATGSELIYGPALNCFINHTFYSTPKPSLGTLISYLAWKYFSIPNSFSFKPHFPYEGPSYVNLRYISVFFSALIVPLSYYTARLMRESSSASTLTSIVFSTELLFISQAHLFSNDSIFQFFCVLSICTLWIYKIYKSFKSFLFMAISIGLTISTKSDGFIFVLLSIITVVPPFHLKGHSFSRLFLLLTVIFSIHFYVYSLHIKLLPFKNPAFYNLNNSIQIPKHISNILIESTTTPEWGQRAKILSEESIFISFIRYLELIKISKDPEKIIPKDQRSNWLDWILVRAPWKIEYEGEDKLLITAGNPIIWLLVIIILIINCIQIIIKKDFSSNTYFLLQGYFISLIYYAIRPGVKTLTDYSIPLIFGIFGLGPCFDLEFSKFMKGFIFEMIWSFTVFGYFF